MSPIFFVCLNDDEGWMTRGIQKKRIKMAIHPSIYLSVRLSLLDIRILFYSILSWQWHHISTIDETKQKKNTKIGSSKCMYVFVYWFFANIWLVDIFFNSIQCNGWLHRNDDDEGMNWKQSQKRKFNWFYVQRERKKMINFFFKKSK